MDENCIQQQQPQNPNSVFLRFCDVVLSYTNYPHAFYDDQDERKIEINSIGESANSDTSSRSSSVGEVDTGEYEDTWGMVTCWCGKPFAGRPMIECESCLIWLHLSCARVRKSNIPKHFKCAQCKPPKIRRKRQSSGNSEIESPQLSSAPTNVSGSSTTTSGYSNNHLSSSLSSSSLLLNQNNHHPVSGGKSHHSSSGLGLGSTNTTSLLNPTVNGTTTTSSTSSFYSSSACVNPLSNNYSTNATSDSHSNPGKDRDKDSKERSRNSIQMMDEALVNISQSRSRNHHSPTNNDVINNLPTIGGTTTTSTISTTSNHHLNNNNTSRSNGHSSNHTNNNNNLKVKNTKTRRIARPRPAKKKDQQQQQPHLTNNENNSLRLNYATSSPLSSNNY